jgi:hypothetical protein
MRLFTSMFHQMNGLQLMTVVSSHALDQTMFCLNSLEPHIAVLCLLGQKETFSLSLECLKPVEISQVAIGLIHGMATIAQVKVWQCLNFRAMTLISSLEY